jgi:3-hydroxyisobutyrate dehydrogenase-like beta-hydroxyacid dehydrogenase
MTGVGVGVVGLGTMGSELAARLLSAGYDTHGTNRTRTKADSLIARGLIWHDTPAEVASAVDVVISMVTDDDALWTVTSGPGGILTGLRPDSVYIDMSSVSPHTSAQIAERVRGIGAEMLDAPVSGSVPQVQQGELAIMVGGDATALTRVMPILQQFGKTITHVGGNGSGVLLKLAVNISLAVQTLAFSEGLLLAERGGVDPALAAQVMSTTSIGSPMLKARVPLLLNLPDTAWFPIRLMQKDVRMALDEAERLGVWLPSTGEAALLLDTASGLGYADRDLAAVHQVLARVESP